MWLSYLKRIIIVLLQSEERWKKNFFIRILEYNYGYEKLIKSRGKGLDIYMSRHQSWNEIWLHHDWLIVGIQKNKGGLILNI